MADATAETAVVETSDDNTQAAATEATPTEQAEAPLGAAGQKALDAMKAERKQLRDELRSVRDEFESFRAKSEGKEAEYTAAQEAQRLKDAALAEARSEILEWQIKAAAKGVLADPQDAYKFLDLDSLEVNDEAAIADALADLVKSKPYLAAQGGQRFQGTADGGARNDATKPSQLTRDDMTRMSPEDIAKAHSEGRFDSLLGRS